MAIRCSVISEVGLFCCATSKMAFYFRRAPVHPKIDLKMGTTTTTFADFCDKAKRFGKKSLKFTVKALVYVGTFCAVVLGLVYFFTANLVSYVLASVWMPVAFKWKPKWFVKKLQQPMSDNPWEFFLEGRHLSVFAFGWFWKWYGTRSWCSRKQRFAFLEGFTPGLKTYPTKVQVQYWEDCDYKNTNFKCLSEDARVKILSNLLWDAENYWLIRTMMEACNKKEKGEFISSLLSALSELNGECDKKMVAKLIISYSSSSYDVSMLTSEEVETLWGLSSSLKLFVLYVKGMNEEYMRRLLSDENMPQYEGKKILSVYIEDKTLSNKCLLMLLNKAESDDNFFSLVQDIILKHGNSSPHFSQ